MGHLWGCPLLMVVAAFLLGVSSDSSSHSLLYFYTTTWEPDQDQFHFIAVGYVDDQLVGHYDSTTRKAVPRVPWIRKVEKDDPRFWDWNTRNALDDERNMKKDLVNLRNLYNRSGGLHTWQYMYGCGLNKDAHREGYEQFAYNGQDYINFDKETLTWTAAVVPAQVTKREWDADVSHSRFLKTYMEEECVEWLQKFLDYGKESLLRREPPTVRVTLKASYSGFEILVCRAHGFHPKEIDATWRKDGEVWEQETFRGGVVPNSDGTYHTWLSVKIDPKDRFRYQCHVEHDGLPEPLDATWEAPASSKTGLIAGVLMGVVASVLLVASIICLLRKRRSSYQAARKAPPISDQEA
ncbi:major histocompatibility complex class I-related gene protein-like isoform X2 [Eublepharis macularius]|nr:major histocompatibility complex class I-related gene protein-like isoform X2 [Eublepharis macularius]XP_054831672.1 major histocompatibility complex class I-related gene protein-like isoform X2 [Eublepharis macularius]